MFKIKVEKPGMIWGVKDTPRTRHAIKKFVTAGDGDVIFLTKAEFEELEGCCIGIPFPFQFVPDNFIPEKGDDDAPKLPTPD